MFYRERDEYGFLSNFYAAPIELDGVVWPTTEHYFQALKFPTLEEYREKIRADPSPRKAKDMGQCPDGFREDWEQVKDEVMYKALRAKFTQHPNLRQELEATGGAYLIEHCRDKYWGDNLDGGTGEKGKNMLGKLLCRLRDELRKEQ